MSNNYPNDKKIFYTYSNNHTKMCPEYMERYKDALVFDRLRRSIFTREQEFGYVSNVNQGIYTYEFTSSSQIRLDVEDGYINFHRVTPEDEKDSNLYITKITYEKLTTLIRNRKLIKNHEYEIKDYQTTTTLTGTGASEHSFSIIVKADSTNKLNCRARAKVKDDDESLYWGNSDLSKWELWYDVENDRSKYEWADPENGKGVIYRMIDEFGNDLPYDFKNIYFLKSSLDNTIKNSFEGNDSTHIYTFFVSANTDASISGKISNIKVYNRNFDDGQLKYRLHRTVFKKSDTSYLDNIIIENCKNFYFYTTNNSFNNYFRNCANIFFGFNGQDNNNNLSNNIIINTDNLLSTLNCENNIVLNSDNINLNKFDNHIENCSYCSTFGQKNFYFKSTYIYNENGIESTYITYNTIKNSTQIKINPSVTYINNTDIFNCNNILFKKSYMDVFISEHCSNISIDSDETTSSTHIIKNIKLYPGLYNRNINIPEINNNYLIEYKPNTTREYII